jgi:hypothetical protein
MHLHRFLEILDGGEHLASCSRQGFVLLDEGNETTAIDFQTKGPGTDIAERQASQSSFKTGSFYCCTKGNDFLGIHPCIRSPAYGILEHADTRGIRLEPPDRTKASTSLLSCSGYSQYPFDEQKASSAQKGWPALRIPAC